jgi:hypothetical protein
MRNKTLLLTGALLVAAWGLPASADAKPYHDRRPSSCVVKSGHHAKHRSHHRSHLSHSGLRLHFNFGAPVRHYRSSPVIHRPAYQVSSCRATVAKVQARLNRLGYRCGWVDGRLGSRTSRAIAYYQRDHCLSVTGTITGQLLRSLRI